MTRPTACAAAVLLAFIAMRPARAQQCHSDAESVAAALTAIRRAVDPCGESPLLRAVLDRLERCPQATYRICTSTDLRRNAFDRPRHVGDRVSPGTISWNPELRTELEDTCDGDPADTVRRDPTASLLHELVHAAQECEGLNPGEHELEAVRIENIYRRATGLCQRNGYGDASLPAPMIKLCTAAACPCSAPLPPPSVAGAPHPVVAAEPDRRARQRSGDHP